MIKTVGYLCLLAGTLAAGNVTASDTWVLGGSSATPGVSVAGYANTGGTASPSSGQTIQSAASTWYSGGGWGIKNADACSSNCVSDYDLNEGIDPEHSVDNNGRFDMMLLSFTAAVDLDQVKMGWTSNDSDITVMAYTGLAPFSAATSLVGLTYTQLLSNGWTAIGNYYNVGTTATNVNPLNKTSSYWLVGAYNPLAYFGSTGSGTTDVQDVRWKLRLRKAGEGLYVPFGASGHQSSRARHPRPLRRRPPRHDWPASARLGLTGEPLQHRNTAPAGAVFVGPVTAATESGLTI